MSDALKPSAVRDALTRALTDDISCSMTSSGVVVDTPFILQDGRLLRVLLRPTGENGTIEASDGGYALEQVEIMFRAGSSRRERLAEIKRIATELHLDWDTALGFTAHSLDEAVRRLPVLAQGVDRTLTLTHAISRRRERPLRARLANDLREAGLKLRTRAKIQTEDGRHESVDYVVEHEATSKAAVRLLSAETPSGAGMAADRAAGVFTRLDRAQYPGLLVAVYDEHTSSGILSFREQFEKTKPERARLVAGDAAAEYIEKHLAS